MVERILIDRLGQHGDQAGGIRLGRVEAVFLDVLDDASGFLAAEFEEVCKLAPADAMEKLDVEAARAELA